MSKVLDTGAPPWTDVREPRRESQIAHAEARYSAAAESKRAGAIREQYLLQSLKHTASPCHPRQRRVPDTNRCEPRSSASSAPDSAYITPFRSRNTGWSPAATVG